MIGEQPSPNINFNVFPFINIILSTIMSLPQFTSAIVVRNQTGLDGLEYMEKLPLPQPKADEVVVKIHAASLNFRDLMIAKVRHRPATVAVQF